jgi:putative ABC transport system permease protein
VSVGDEVSITIPSVNAHLRQRVAGFVTEPLGTFAYLSLPSLAALVQPNTVFLRFAPGADPSVMRQRLSSLPEVAAYTDARSLERAAASFMGLFYAFVGLMLLFGGILAFVLVFNAMSVNVAERSTEIASLRAEGVSRNRIGRLIGTENLLVTAIGIAPGLVVGYLVARTFMASFSSDLFSFDLAIRPLTFVWCAIAMLMVGLVSLWPALRSVARIDIATVLRERSG